MNLLMCDNNDIVAGKNEANYLGIDVGGTDIK